MSKSNEIELTANAAKLLQKLGTDDGERQAFERDPRGTLAKYGLNLDPALVPNAVTLPPKEDFQREFDRHIDWFTNRAAQMAFIFTVFFSGKVGQGGQG
jgi:putative modified peptide